MSVPGRDEQIQQMTDWLEEAAKDVREAEDELLGLRDDRDYYIRALLDLGVPEREVATLARLSPGMVNRIRQGSRSVQAARQLRQMTASHTSEAHRG